MFVGLVACGGSGAGGEGGPSAGSGDLAPGAPVDLGLAAPLDLAPGADLAPAGDMTSATCGSSAATYTLLTGSDAGLVRDNTTGLVWMRDSVGGGEPPQTQQLAAQYCAGRNMRLPTRDEALRLAAHYGACAFGHWQTWTSTATPILGDAWVVDYTGGASPQVANNFPSAVLCVR
jgi:hypothetical protein